MKLITEPKALARTFSTLIERHNRVSFAVAWATKGFDGYEKLVANSRKISRGIVGTHFCQTHPDFIERFQHHKSSRSFGL
ncbi:hypothetical protein [Bradyrhizobium sp. SSUT77]|uniref:hypothetical protein n=1 Tax=Bradyrhizobium sp. SSUT77 TaxID=3040603 RepID=UPI00244B548F|nr:hypothetical protein [Bradyrhizobium sp. SSUT77]